MVLGATQERRAIEVEMTPLSQSLVIMNPPFTTPTNHAADHAKPGNPAYAAFNTTLEEQDVMSKKAKVLAEGTIGDGNAGLGSYFTAIAHNMVKPNGHIALVLPLSAMTGGSYSARKNQLFSWQKLRRLLSENYNDIMVITIVQADAEDCSFSADTDMVETIIVARRLAHGERPSSKACFVSLVERPSDKLAAQEIAKAIKKGITKLTQMGEFCEINVGDALVGTVQLRAVKPLDRWTTVSIANLGLVQTAEELASGNLRLPQRTQAISVPMTRMSTIGKVGPLHRDIDEAWRDPVRQELDRRLLTEVLGLDDAAVEQLAILRNQWCAEPTVTGTKKTGPPD